MDCSSEITATSRRLFQIYSGGIGLLSGKEIELPDWSTSTMKSRVGGRRLLQIGLLVAVAGILILVVTLGKGLRPNSSAMLIGKKFPAIEAEGWLNWKAPKAETFKGKVLVIEAWATRCGPCRALAPEMVKLQKKYQDRDVVFIGITDENGPLVPTIEDYLKTTGIGWLNAYGAYGTISRLGAEFIPYVWVVDSTGMIAWTTESGGAIEDGIKLALDHREKQMAKAPAATTSSLPN